jgi:hypothetical protein
MTCAHIVQTDVARVPGWIVGPCVKCGKEVAIPVEQWAARASGPEALTGEMRSRLYLDKLVKVA